MAKDTEGTTVTISAPKFQTAAFNIRGNAPYVSNRLAAKVLEGMKLKQQQGAAGRNKKQREAKDFEECAKQSMYISTEGWMGLNASAIRQAVVSACRLVGFKMTIAKLTLFVQADGFAEDGTPMIRFAKGEPHPCEHYVRLSTGVADIASRMMWDPGWEAVLRMRWDSDQFTLTDVTNLLMRVGQQVGIGAGRPDSKTSAGMGWGTFDLVNPE